MPVMAQETADPTSILDQIPPELVESIITNATVTRDVIIGVLLVALIAVVMVAMPLLYRGASPFVQRLMAESHKEAMTFLVGIIGQKRDEAALNNVDWDDPIWDWLYTVSKEQRDKAGTPDAPDAPAVG